MKDQVMPQLEMYEKDLNESRVHFTGTCLGTGFRFKLQFFSEILWFDDSRYRSNFHIICIWFSNAEMVFVVVFMFCCFFFSFTSSAEILTLDLKIQDSFLLPMPRNMIECWVLMRLHQVQSLILTVPHQLENTFFLFLVVLFIFEDWVSCSFSGILPS